MRNLLRLLKWLVISAFVLALGLVGYVIISFLVLGPLCVKYGIGWDAAFHKWHLAMEAGDPSDAKRWAGRMIGYSNPKVPRHATEAHQCLAGAFELAGDYERSLELYDQYPGNLFSTFSSFRAFVTRMETIFHPLSPWRLPGMERRSRKLSRKHERTKARKREQEKGDRS